MGAPAAARRELPEELDRARLTELYYFLRLTRNFEERLSILYRQGHVIGGLYRSVGQEGESVGSAYALEPCDVLSPLIRNLGAVLVRGAKPVEILRQYLAKGTGPTRGRELNIHFSDLERGYLGQISHLGDMVPVMAGVALSFRMRDEPRVGLAYVGDGATSTGAFHEGVNFAAVRLLPLVVLIEHNGWAYSTPTNRQTAVTRLADKAIAYGVPASTVDGNDVIAVHEATRAAVRRARRGDGVQVLEVVTFRRKGHAEHDDQRYQSVDLLQHWARNDPIERFVRTVQDAGWLESDVLGEIDRRVDSELDDAVRQCEAEPAPIGPDALRDVFATPTAAAGGPGARSRA